MKKYIIGIFLLPILIGGWWWADSHYSAFCRTLAGCRFHLFYKEASVTPVNKPVKIDQTYYITLQRDPQRVSHVKSQLDRNDIPQPIEMFAAVDGLTIDDQDRKSLKTTGLLTTKGSKLLNKGEIGCALSHQAVWQKVAEDPAIEVALILEDDVELIANFNERWEEVSSQIPDDFDIIYLYNYPERTRLFAINSPAIYRPLHNFCFHGYLISKKGAKKMMEQLFPIRKPIDTSLDRLYMSKFSVWRTLNLLLGIQNYDQDHERVKLYVLTPDMLILHPFPTNIQITRQ